MTLALILFVLFYILMLAVQQYRPWVCLLYTSPSPRDA